MEENDDKNDCGASGHHPPSDPNAGVGDPTDGRDAYQWMSKYPNEATREIYSEAILMVTVLLISIVLLLATWRGWVCSLLNICSKEDIITFSRYVYYGLSGLLAGTAFSMKYLYRAVARGWWHQDRKLWRLMSPLLSMVLAFIVGAMIDSSLLPQKGDNTAASAISIGFLVGYFADQAIAKMYEIAMVLFGTSATTKTGDGKK